MVLIIKVWGIGKRGKYVINERVKGECKFGFIGNNSSYNFIVDIGVAVWVGNYYVKLGV